MLVCLMLSNKLCPLFKVLFCFCCSDSGEFHCPVFAFAFLFFASCSVWLNPSSTYVKSVTVFFSSVTSICYFLLFSFFFWLKFSLCLPILLPSEVSILLPLLRILYQVNYLPLSHQGFFTKVLSYSFVSNIFLFPHFT